MLYRRDYPNSCPLLLKRSFKEVKANFRVEFAPFLQLPYHMKLIPMITSRNTVSPLQTMVDDFDNLPKHYLIVKWCAAPSKKVMRWSMRFDRLVFSPSTKWRMTDWVDNHFWIHLFRLDNLWHSDAVDKCQIIQTAFDKTGVIDSFQYLIRKLYLGLSIKIGKKN